MATGQSSYLSSGGTTYFDLTQDTGDRAEINNALFFQNKPDSSSGTGLIQAIARVQDPGNGDGFENGYNTSFRPLSYEENTSPNFTTSLLLSEVPVVTIDGTQYYEFRLDINQLNSSSLLSLDEIKLYSSAVGDGLAQGTIGGAWFTANADLVYDMDGAGNTSILLDAGLSSGSGSSDMFFYVPVSNFGAVDPDDTYVTLYSEFGATGVLDGADGLTPLDDPLNTALGDNGDDTGDVATAVFGTYTANDGFEEWSVSKQTGGVISGYKWADADGDGVWDAGETGLGGFTIDYTISYDEGKGHNSQHVVVDGSVITSDGTMDVDGDGIIDPLGFYSIAVPASSDKNETYTITLTEQPKAGYANTYDGDATANSTTTFNFSSNNLTTTGTPASPDISGHFGVTETMNFGNRLLVPHVTIDKDASGYGECADTVDEVITYTVTVTNDGELDLTNVVLTDSFEGGLDVIIGSPTGDDDDGDASNGLTPDGILQVGEVWTYTYTHTVSQDDINSNGGNDDGTLDNVATVNADSTNGSVTDNDDAIVPVCQDPVILIDKTASGYGECADVVGETITYTINVSRAGNVDLENVVVTDDFADADPTYVSGDDGDNILEAGETWTYTASHVVTQDDINNNGNYDSDDPADGINDSLRNVATVTADALTTGTDATANDDAIVPVCQDPVILIDKTASGYGECADVAGETITYTINVSRAGNVDLENVVVTDDFADANPTYVSGDDGDNILEAGETWVYTASHVVTQADIDSGGNYDSNDPADGINDSLRNVATVTADALTTGADATANDDAVVAVCQDIAVDLIKYVDVGFGFDDANGPIGPQNVNIGGDVDFKVTIENTGNVTLTDVDVNDTYQSGGASIANLLVDNGALTAYALAHNGVLTGDDDDGDAGNGLNPDGILQVGETWTITYTEPFDPLSFSPGEHVNTADVQTAEGATDEDPAHYFSLVDTGLCPRTPGFWQNPKNGGQFWNGVGGDEKHAGESGFPDGELLYAVDSDHDGDIDANDAKGLLIGDYDHDGLTGATEDTLFVSYGDALKLINASNKQLNASTGDGRFMLGRDMVASWLNYLQGSGFGDASDPQSPHHYLDDSIDWMQIYSGKTAGGTNETFDTLLLTGGAIKTSTAIWKTPQSGFDHSAGQMHSALDYYNNTGQTQPGGTHYANCESQHLFEALTIFEQSHPELV